MYKPLEAFIGLSYVRAKRRNHFISFISLTSMLGIALGVTTLITGITVMNGFEKELRTRILGAIAHATIQPADGLQMEWRNVIERVEEHPEVNVSTAGFGSRPSFSRFEIQNRFLRLARRTFDHGDVPRSGWGVSGDGESVI